MTSWDPNTYLRFGDERTRPAADLAFRVALEAPRTVIDLGCGPGNSTQVLRQRWPGARVCGLDNSPEMIAAARQSYPGQEWMQADIEGWSADVPYDVVFSNAALQWVRDHVALTRHLFAQVNPGGALAFQIPSGTYSPVRTFIHEIAQDKAWVSRMDGPSAAVTMEEPQVYYDALAPQAKSVDIWETEYCHVMESPSAIVEWISSTGLRPFLDALDSPEEKQRFVTRLAERVTEAYTTRSDGRVLFPFKRTFVIAYA
ncbi:MAG: methyltransferase domain-containing protein [Verrucomicrobia bacterium]|nr:methyltransferase domain-containing protein [Verrucomicrobiota bacterium]